MKTDDLHDPTNDDLNKSENVENEKVEIDAVDSTEVRGRMTSEIENSTGTRRKKRERRRFNS
jgi:hypothetical protein